MTVVTRRFERTLPILSAILFGLVQLFPLNAWADLEPGDLVAIGRFDAAEESSSIYSFDPETGAREIILSDPRLGFIQAVLVSSVHEISVLHTGIRSRIIKINLETGELDEMALDFFATAAFASALDGGFFVTASLSTPAIGGGETTTSGIVHVDWDSGETTVIAQDGALEGSASLHQDPCDDFIVSKGGKAGGFTRVSASTGARYAIPQSGPLSPRPPAVTVGRAGEIFMVEKGPEETVLIRLDALTGDVNVIGVLEEQNPSIRHAIAQGEDERLYALTGVGPRTAFTFQILSIDPETGERFILVEGDDVGLVNGLAVVPSQSSTFDWKSFFNRKRICRIQRWKQFINHIESFPLPSKAKKKRR